MKKYECGFVCEPNAESIARTIIKAQKNPKDNLIEMGKNGRILAESQFDRRMIGRRYRNFLNNIPS